MVNSVRKGYSHRLASRHGPGTPNGVVVDSIYATASKTSTDAKVGTRVPNWRQKIARVTQAGSAYSRSATTLGFVTGSITGSYAENTQNTRRTDDMLYGELFLTAGPIEPTLPSFPSLDVNARVNFLSKCRSVHRAFQGGVFLGELREAIHMIARPGAALRRGVSAYLAEAKKVVRRNHYTDRGRLLTKTWLEYNYGWRPLIRDIDAGMAALADTRHIVPDIVVGYSKDEIFSEPYVRLSTAPGSFIQAAASFHERWRGSVRYLGCVAWESENRASQWQEHWGLTARDFIPTVWELIPYSFIVDYFSNLGAILDASSFGTVSLRWGIKSEMLNSSVRMGRITPGFNSSSALEPKWVTASLSLGQLSKWSFQRSLVSSVSVGLNDLQFKIPGVGDWRKWANLSALAIEKMY